MYSFESRVRYSEIGQDECLTIPGIVNYLQDCSTFHSASVGRGFEHIRATHLAWLLAGWQIEIDRLPRFDEEIRVSTWATGFKGLMANRSFTICEAADANRERPLVRADSRWFLFDGAAGRPVRIPEEESAPYRDDVEHEAPLDMPRYQRRIPVADAGEAAAPVIVTPERIDTNGHVNNAQYVSMAIVALTEQRAFDDAAIRTLDVRYHEAAKLGDTVHPHVHVGAEGTVIVTLDNAAGCAYATVRATSESI